MAHKVTKSKTKTKTKHSPSLEAALKSGEMIRLDIGCGADKQPGFIGIDIRKLPGVDIVQNVEEFPWPLPSDCASLAMASHLVEHINPAGGTFIKFMDEVWRVLKPGAQFMIALPYAGSPGYWQDPTHINGCNEYTWTYFDPLCATGSLWYLYKPKPWKILSLQYSPIGNMEVVLEKRREDKTYKGASNE
jgi:SAM-dependent methyltransferase